MRNPLRAHIALTGVIGAVPGALLGGGVLLGAILMGTAIGVGSAGRRMTDSETADVVSFVQHLLHGSFVAASALTFLTSWVAVRLRFRKHPEAARASPAGVAAGTIAGCVAACWTAASLAEARGASVPASMPYLALLAGFVGAFAATFLRRGLLVHACCAAAFLGVLATGGRYARSFPIE